MVTMVPVQQQEGSVDCGLFSIANAYTLAVGRQPRNVNYDQGLMRSHLEQCFETEELSAFPPSPRPIRKSRLKHLSIQVYCDCQRPECYDDMIECDGCTHFKCVGLCSDSITDDWMCSTCSM